MSAASALWTHQEQNYIGLYAENVKEHTTDGEMEKSFRQIIIINLLLAGMMIQADLVYAMDSYLRELLPGSRASFKHWNLVRSEVTGHSH